MRCDECISILEEYFDGELEEAGLKSVNDHVNSCNRCLAQLRLLEREQSFYSSYERDLNAGPSLWVGIRARITSNETLSVRRRLLSVLKHSALKPAFVTVAVALLLGGWLLTRHSRGPFAPAPDGQTTEAARGEPANQDSHMAGAGQPRTSVLNGGRNQQSYAARKVRRANLNPLVQTDQMFNEAIKTLSDDVIRRQDEIDFEARVHFEVTLAFLDRTIDDTRRAAYRNPRDPVALQYLLEAYSKKVEVLRDMASY